MKKPARKSKKRPAEWTLAEVVNECPRATAIWVALHDMSVERGSPVVTPTRKELAARASTSLTIVSRSLTTLTKAGWIDREHVPVVEGNRQVATMLRVVIRRSAQKIGATVKNAVAHKKSALASAQKIGADFPSERGAAQKAVAPSVEGTPSSRTATTQQTAEHPAAIIERKRLEAIRAKREANGREQQPVAKDSAT